MARTPGQLQGFDIRKVLKQRPGESNLTLRPKHGQRGPVEEVDSCREAVRRGGLAAVQGFLGNPNVFGI